ncbi:hypothetical protein DBZ36_14485 [Alginatibacterium sediminis]|uniref:Uncharacterized protein n=1 Tax=Alginatibacterium sediminis TaxID=2164068 RepID=A0A420E847_9ALTE|nr:hypothetical protein [Alginatibacterium sediminis]RKF15591.1 hypothetical protein DBZ36_14485 [Alginatibacterium sediminis]
MQISANVGISTYQQGSLNRQVSTQPIEPQLPNKDEIGQELKNRYDSLSPEQQLSTKRNVESYYQSAQDTQQQVTDAKRNTVLGANAVQHTEKLAEIYYTSSTGNEAPKSSSSVTDYAAKSTLDGSVDRIVEQQVNARRLELYKSISDYSPQGAQPELYSVSQVV